MTDQKPLGYFSRRLLILEAALWLTVANVALRLLRFRRLAAYLGAYREESPPTGGRAEKLRAHAVAWAIRRAARRVPFEAACLAQSIAAMAMLGTRRQGSTLYLGVARDEDAGLKAHAWLRSGEVMVAGAGEHQRYVVVGQFSRTGAPERTPG